MTDRGTNQAHAHGNPRATAARHERRTWAVAALAVAAAAAELIGGWRTGSAALTAEGLHMGAHVSAFLLAALAYLLARSLDRAGHPRLALLVPDYAALFNGLLLLTLGASLATESAQALSHPAPIDYGWALGVAVFGLGVNIVSAVLLHHDHAEEHEHGRDMNFRAIYLHVIGDAVVAVLAIAGLLLGRTLGWRWTDSVAGAIGAVLVVILGLQVTLRSLRYLTGGRAREAAAASLGEVLVRSSHSH